MNFRSSVVASAGAALLFGWLLATPAFAQCSTDNAIFEDEFEFLDATWGDPDDSFFVEDGSLVIKGWAAHVNFATKNDAAVVNNWANGRKQEHPAREKDRRNHAANIKE